ncbi:flavin reductase family protein [Rhodococcus sp. JVH1]|uniref:flavin reductase family protein n=1 Tax=Rhodococcus sp. JVH1 TaxID=745408 RepID=UPI0009FC51DF|nr:flavin reductase family protein [Rhodococcus sp. JVH1]
MTITALAKTTTSTSKVTTCSDDPALIRETFGRFPSGVVVVATEHNLQKHALVASSFMVGVSLDPCLVAVAVQRSSKTWPLVRSGKTLGVSVFSRGQGPLTRQFAGKNRAARFDEVAVEVADSGAVFIEDAALWLECVVHDEVEAGDHWMILLETTKMGFSGEDPLVWHRAQFRDLVAAATSE